MAHVTANFVHFSPARQIAQDVSTNPYTWPGGYPRYAITDDGGCLCKACCESEVGVIAGSYYNDGWHVVASDINWEDTSLQCDHCYNTIECTYGDDD